MSRAVETLAADVEVYAVVKGQSFMQTNSSAAFPAGDESFVFQAFVDTPEGDPVTSATLKLPNGTLVPIPDEDGFEFGAQFASVSALDAAYPNGTYAIITQGVNDGRRTNTLNLAGNLYPPTPRISNFDAAQAVNPAADFILSWDPLAGGTVNDYIQVSIRSCGEGDNEILFTPSPGEPGALNGTATSFTIAARRLRPGQGYNVELLVAKPSAFDTTTYPGALGLAAYFKIVQTTLVTTGTQTGCSPGQFSLAFNFQSGSFNGTNGAISFPTGISYYFVLLNIEDGPFPPTVTFTGPPGSGLNNTTNQSFGSGGNNAFYNSPSINTPPFPPGGVYTVNYKGTNLSWNLLDPQAGSQQVLILPTAIVDSAGALQEMRWTYRDTSGNVIPPQPFMAEIGLSIEGTNQMRLYDVFTGGDNAIPSTTTNHVLTQTVHWTNVARVFMNFVDVVGNQFTSYWDRSSEPGAAPYFISFGRNANGNFEMLLQGMPGSSYRFEGSTTLQPGSWQQLQTSGANPGDGRVYFQDTGSASLSRRFYRAVLLQ